MREILTKLINKSISIEEAENLLKADLIENVSNLAQLDVFRKLRTGVPEVIYAEKKDLTVLLEIINKFLSHNNFVIISRYNETQEKKILEIYSDRENYSLTLNELGRIIIIKDVKFEFPKKGGKVGIITAGSSDIFVAEEAKIISKSMGCEVFTSYDVGIAGFHRIFPPLSKMIKNGVHVIIVCAGMEGTLPGVVSALVDIPVIGVPVSSGYGIGEKGKGALTTMLQSCSPGLLVVNIDNGFGAGASAALIANKIAK
ncbi:MAG: nickel pincer cofactor biosynthesis protein LarB [Candidatus Lokiarchaeota archaeon]|nr:nickel pincer cofactor biosynthesis protein LarB [Candidatus Lokiarchaeota archaeon]MBD3202471.1 nickel pincer cofactor biosynthesis protein LarB [Candidatus Lokiarchaeota archaeon]